MRSFSALPYDKNMGCRECWNIEDTEKHWIVFSSNSPLFEWKQKAVNYSELIMEYGAALNLFYGKQIDQNCKVGDNHFSSLFISYES